MVVESPATICYNILEVSTREHILLCEGVWSNIADRLALARDRTSPNQLIVLATTIWVILHILPDSVTNLLQLVLNLVSVEDCVELDTRTLNPPEVVVVGTPDNLVVELLVWNGRLWSVVVEVVVGEVVSPLWRVEWVVLIGLAQLQENRVTHCVVCRLLVCYIRLVVCGFRLGTTAVLCTRKTENTITSTIQEQLTRDGVLCVVVAIPALYGSNLIAIHYNIAYRSVEQKADILLLYNCRIHHIIPQRITLQRVVVEVAALHLLDDTSLLTLILANTYDTHTHLARGVTTEHRTVLNEDYLRAVTRSRNCSAKSRKTTTADNDWSLHLNLANNLVVCVCLKCRALLLSHQLYACDLRRCSCRDEHCYKHRQNGNNFLHNLFRIC